MANIAALNTVYNHYLTTYTKNRPGAYDTHKKSELKNVYNSIVKLNKESPLFLIDNSDETKSFAVGLKEDAVAFRNTIASLGGLDEDELLKKKVAYSSNTDMVTAEFNSQISDTSQIPEFEIKVDSLAAPQVNIGRFLYKEALSGLTPDTYSFDISINDYNYEFQFSIGKKDTNISIMERLNRLINNSGIGITSEILESGDGKAALKIESLATGLPAGKEQLFSISDNNTSKRSGIVNHLDIAGITRPAVNAEVRIDDVPKTATSNRFTIDNMYTLTLHNLGSTPDESATIGIKNDMESLAENVKTLVNGYNSFLQSAIDYSETHKKSNYLIRDMQRITSNYMAEFTSFGLSSADNGTLQLDKTAFTDAASGGDTHAILSVIKDFTNSALSKANKVALNPMDYVERKIVAYKNPGKNFASPYITSAYSGMLFNSYC